MKFRKDDFYTYIKIIYSSTVTTQLSIMFLSESVIQMKVKYIAFDADSSDLFKHVFNNFMQFLGLF